jgi:hypothetical protein
MVALLGVVSIAAAATTLAAVPYLPVNVGDLGALMHIHVEPLLELGRRGNQQLGLLLQQARQEKQQCGHQQ